MCPAFTPSFGSVPPIAKLIEIDDEADVAYASGLTSALVGGWCGCK